MDPELILRTSALLIMAAGLTRLLRTAAPATRHLVWHLAIVLVVLAPVLAPFTPRFDLPIGEAAGEIPAARPSAPVTVISDAAPAPGPTPMRTMGVVATTGSVAVGMWFLLCWLLSGLSVKRGSRPAAGVLLSEARSVAARLGFEGTIQVRTTQRERSPHVAGLFESVVMMPPSAAQWTTEDRQAAFVHELTHIRRHDRRTQAVAQLACAIYWFNPLVWHAAAGLARERERACDDEVLRVGVKPSAYAALLLDLARRPSAWSPATALSIARPSAIEGRLLMVLANVERTPRHSTRWLVGAAVVLLTAAIFGAEPAASNGDSLRQSTALQAATPNPAPIVRPQAVMHVDDQEPAAGFTDILVRSLNDASRQVREQATLGLALTPGNAVIDPLLAALKDSDSQVREKAAIGLAFRRDARILEPLLTTMRDTDGQVREKAAIALGASGDARAFEALTRATTDPDPQVREKAVAGLVLLGLRK